MGGGGDGTVFSGDAFVAIFGNSVVKIVAIYYVGIVGGDGVRGVDWDDSMLRVELILNLFSIILRMATRCAL